MSKSSVIIAEILGACHLTKSFEKIQVRHRTERKYSVNKKGKLLYLVEWSGTNGKSFPSGYFPPPEQWPSFRLWSNKEQSMFRGIISISFCSKQRKLLSIPLNFDSVLLLLYNSKLAYCCLILGEILVDMIGSERPTGK